MNKNVKHIHMCLSVQWPSLKFRYSIREWERAGKTTPQLSLCFLHRMRVCVCVCAATHSQRSLQLGVSINLLCFEDNWDIH